MVQALVVTTLLTITRFNQVFLEVVIVGLIKEYKRYEDICPPIHRNDTEIVLFCKKVRRKVHVGRHL